jgi:hypothetical protein
MIDSFETNANKSNIVHLRPRSDLHNYVLKCGLSTIEYACKYMHVSWYYIRWILR